MKTFPAAAKIFGLTLTSELEVPDVCRHLDKQLVNYQVGAGGIIFKYDWGIGIKTALNKVNGTWCFEMFK